MISFEFDDNGVSSASGVFDEPSTSFSGGFQSYIDTEVEEGAILSE